MDDLAYKTSEQKYYTKKELAKYLNISMIDQVWKDVEEYRSHFKVEDACLKRGTYIVLNGYVCKKMMMLMEKMLMLPDEDGDLHVLNDWIKNSIKNENEIFLCENFLKECYRKEIEYLTCKEHLFLFFFEEKDCQMYLERNCPFMIRLTSLITRDDFSLTQKIVLTACVLKQVNCEKFIPYLNQECFNTECTKEEDQTYNLLALIKVFNQILNHRLMVKKEIPLHKEGMETLMYRYPMLSKAAVSFYTKHHQPGHYYTISQYIEENNVCYETGRQAMEQLVQYRFYQKTKVGKKFVYSIF